MVLGVVGAVLALFVSPVQASVAHSHHRNHHAGPHFNSQPGALTAARSRTTSQNWSGYVVRGGRFTSITGSWTVSPVNCSSTPNGVAAMWVGLDGSGSRTVEQTGTFSACQNGVADYAAWYEAFPAPSIILPNPVGPGDSMTASVTSTGKGTFSLVLTNNSRGWTSTNQIQVNGRLASAEAVVEAPSLRGQIVPLADFGVAGFSGVTVNGSPLAALRPVPITMVSLGGVTKAATGPLSGGGFSVAWRHA